MVAAQMHQLKVREYNCHMAKMFTPIFIQVPSIKDFEMVLTRCIIGRFPFGSSIL